MSEIDRTFVFSSHSEAKTLLYRKKYTGYK